MAAKLINRNTVPVWNIVGRFHKSTMAAYSEEDKLRELEVSNTFPFSKAKIGHFFQQAPALGNTYSEDIFLQSYLQRVMPPEIFNEVKTDLHKFGEYTGKEIYQKGLACENNPPTLKQYNAWGKRIDDILTCPEWNEMKHISAKEGLIAIAYERKFAEWSRLYQVAKLYLFNPSSGMYGCPLAMTDGAARTSELFRKKGILDKAFQHLTSRDPQKFWTSGQWMTERKGGSDVANGTETLAVLQPDGSYKLYGYKWFTSATDADMTLTLARIVDKDGIPQPGTKGLSMFFLQVRNERGELNNIEVQRLKDKLGTRQLPTAELLLDGVPATLVSDVGRGVASISTMLTLTRLHNTVGASAGMRRMMQLARDYSHKRSCFGNVIKDYPLHVKNLSNMEIETRAATIFTLELAHLLGREEVGSSSKQESELFRMLMPIAKLYTAKQAVAVASEGLECFGGAGYLEDTGLPQLLRDAQVLPIWEGTTNILSLDVLRALVKSQGQALQAFHTTVHERLHDVTKIDLTACLKELKGATDKVVTFAAQNQDKLEMCARDFAFSLARIYMGMLLVEHANWSQASEMDILVATRWCSQDLAPVISRHTYEDYAKQTGATEAKLVFDGYPHSKL